MKIKDLEEMTNRELWRMVIIFGILGFSLFGWGMYGLVVSIVEQINR